MINSKLRSLPFPHRVKRRADASLLKGGTAGFDSGEDLTDVGFTDSITSKAPYITDSRHVQTHKTHIILCIETGTEVCSVALAEDGKLRSLLENSGGRDHARRLAGMVDEILRENSLRPDELSAVAVSSGPGSYTGLRIGVSLAKGLCYGLGIPLIGVSSLEALAHTAAEDYRAGIIDVDDFTSARLCPMIDARRMEVYGQVFNSALQPLSEVVAEVVTEESFNEWRGHGELIIFGDGAAKCAEIMGDNVKLVNVTASARGQVALAHTAFTEGKFEDTAYFEPFYLKDFIIKPSTKKLF